MTPADTWFDGDTGLCRLDERIVTMPSYRSILQDEKVTWQELADQAARVTHLLRQLEAMLPPEAHAAATEALCELAVLSAIQRHYELQTLSSRMHP